MDSEYSSLPAFGFFAAVLEGLPIIGLVFFISNRIGAAMWAHVRTVSSSTYSSSTIHDKLQTSRNANISSRKPASVPSRKVRILSPWRL
jgi:hypothetical protein